jgi:hypothetical protein
MSEPAPPPHDIAAVPGTESAGDRAAGGPPDTGAPPAAPVRAARRVRLPGFLVPEETGLGDVIKRASASAGIKPCGGCQRRAETLNRWVTLAPRNPR